MYTDVEYNEEPFKWAFESFRFANFNIVDLLRNVLLTDSMLFIANAGRVWLFRYFV